MNLCFAYIAKIMICVTTIVLVSCSLNPPTKPALADAALFSDGGSINLVIEDELGIFHSLFVDHALATATFGGIFEHWNEETGGEILDQKGFKKARDLCVRLLKREFNMKDFEDILIHNEMSALEKHPPSYQ